MSRSRFLASWGIILLGWFLFPHLKSTCGEFRKLIFIQLPQRVWWARLTQAQPLQPVAPLPEPLTEAKRMLVGATAVDYRATQALRDEVSNEAFFSFKLKALPAKYERSSPRVISLPEEHLPEACRQIAREKDVILAWCG